MSVFPTACRHPGCPKITTSDYCEAHSDVRAVERARERRRTDWRQSFYRSARWQRARAAFLRKHPLCGTCSAAGRTEPAVIAHHTTPLEALPPSERCRWDHLAPRCRACHNKEHFGG